MLMLSGAPEGAFVASFVAALVAKPGLFLVKVAPWGGRDFGHFRTCQPRLLPRHDPVYPPRKNQFHFVASGDRPSGNRRGRWYDFEVSHFRID